MAPVASEFDKIIHEARERKKNEALANKIFSTNRRQSQPSKLKAAPGGSLASRVGVKKSQPQPQNKTSQRHRATAPAGNVNGEWTHDLHNSLNGSSRGSLGSRVTLPGAANANNSSSSNNNNSSAAQKGGARRRANMLNAALGRIDTDESVREQVNIVKPASTTGISIRGLAGPFAVMAQNFAPGTTAADIESAMTPVGGEMMSCKIIKSQPMILVEMVFSSREGGERVIETFHNKTADGRIIQVFPKPGGYRAEQHDTRSRNNNNNSNNNNREQIVDGRNGFSEDLMSVDKSASSNGNRLFYTDKGGATSRRGRGFQGGRQNAR